MLGKYVYGTTSFAILCSLCWLLLGGSWWSALLMYVVSGQACMVSLIALSYMRHTDVTRSTD